MLEKEFLIFIVVSFPVMELLVECFSVCISSLDWQTWSFYIRRYNWIVPTTINTVPCTVIYSLSGQLVFIFIFCSVITNNYCSLIQLNSLTLNGLQWLGQSWISKEMKSEFSLIWNSLIIYCARLIHVLIIIFSKCQIVLAVRYWFYLWLL